MKSKLSAPEDVGFLDSNDSVDARSGNATFRIFTNLACCLLLLPGIAGCAAVGVDKIAELPSTHRVAIVSALGDELTVQTTGTTIFNNWERMEQVPDWKIDEHVESIVYEKLQRAGKFQLVDVDLSEMRNAFGHVGADLWSGAPRFGSSSEALRGMRSMRVADSVLLIGNARVDDSRFGTNQYFTGFGIFQRSILGTKRAVNYAAVRISLIDVQSGEGFAGTSALANSPRSPIEWVSKTARLSVSDFKRTRPHINALLDEATTQALIDLRLTSEK